MKHFVLTSVLLGASSVALATPVSYTMDPDHTFPSFEAPHIGGISVWRGKFTKTSGTVVLDTAAKTGKIDVTIDANSVDIGHKALEEHLRKSDFLDTEKFPTITYKSDSIKFKGDAPTEVMGTLTLRGVSKPVTLKVNSFKCIQHPMLKKEVCGADVSAQINRSDFGVSYGVPMTGDWVKFQIQVEALKDDKQAG